MPVGMKVGEIKQKLEPAIVSEHARDDELHQVNPEHVQLSQAISTKRIADALEVISTQLRYDPNSSMPNLWDILNNISHSR